MNRALVLSIASIATVTTIIGANLTYASSNTNQGMPSQIQQLENMVNSLENTVTSQANEISTLEQTVSTENDAISGLQSTTKSQAAQIDTLNTTLNQQQNSISSLNTTVTQLQQQLSALQQPAPSSATYTISGTLKDSNDTPFFSPLYLIDSTGKSVEEQSTYNSSTGQFSFANVPDGTYTFKFGMPEYQFTSPTVTVSGGNVSNLALTTQNAVYAISGVAVNNGQPIVGAGVTVFDAYGYTGGYFGPSTTDSSGHFSIHGLANGTYTIYIGLDWSKGMSNLAATAVASGSVTVNGGNVTDMTINGLEAGSSSTSTNSTP